MKTWKHGIFGILAIIALTFAFIACDDKETHTHEWEWKVTTPATPTADGLETETCKTCGATNGTRIIEQTEPTDKTFSVSFNFANPGSPDNIMNVIIKDERTDCGSQNLDQLGIKTTIQQAIQGAFNLEDNTNWERTRFRNVFGTSNNGGASITVNNPATTYKIKATDSSAIYFHIDYLKSNQSDIQQNILDAIIAMNPASPDLPYNAE